jgi:hypothetical protein
VTLLEGERAGEVRHSRHRSSTRPSQVVADVPYERVCKLKVKK